MTRVLSKIDNKILYYAEAGQQMQMNDFVRCVDEAKRSTLKVHINRLVDEGYLVRYGIGREVWYEVVE